MMIRVLWAVILIKANAGKLQGYYFLDFRGYKSKQLFLIQLYYEKNGSKKGDLM